MTPEEGRHTKLGGVLQSLRMEGSNLSEFSKFCGGPYLSESLYEGGSNLSEFLKYKAF